MATELEMLAERLAHSLQPSIPYPYRFALVIHDPGDGDVACAADGDPMAASKALRYSADDVAKLAEPAPPEPRARPKKGKGGQA